jgi:hypothetical protein
MSIYGTTPQPQQTKTRLVGGPGSSRALTLVLRTRCNVSYQFVFCAAPLGLVRFSCLPTLPASYVRALGWTNFATRPTALGNRNRHGVSLRPRLVDGNA